MKNITKNQRTFIAIAAVAIAAVLAYSFIAANTDSSDDDVDKTGSSHAEIREASSKYGKQEDATQDATSKPSVTSTSLDTTGKADAYASAREANKQETQRNLEKMQALLDEAESKRDEVVAFALQLSKGNRLERAMAIDAFEWVGGKESSTALIDLLDDESVEVEERAFDVLKHLLQESMITEVQLLDTNQWLEVMNTITDSNDLYAMFTLLSGFNVVTAAPVFIELYNSTNATLKNHAQEFMEFIANGESTIPTKEAAEKWFADYKEFHGIIDDPELTQDINSATSEEQKEAQDVLEDFKQEAKQ